MSLDYAEDLIEAMQEQKEEYVLIVVTKNKKGEVLAHVSYDVHHTETIPVLTDNLKYLAKKLQVKDKPKETSAE